MAKNLLRPRLSIRGGDYPPKPEDRSGDGVTTTVTDALTEILILGLSNDFLVPKLKLFSDTPWLTAINHILIYMFEILLFCITRQF